MPKAVHTSVGAIIAARLPVGPIGPSEAKWSSRRSTTVVAARTVSEALIYRAHPDGDGRCTACTSAW